MVKRIVSIDGAIVVESSEIKFDHIKIIHNVLITTKIVMNILKCRGCRLIQGISDVTMSAPNLKNKKIFEKC